MIKIDWDQIPKTNVGEVKGLLQDLIKLLQTFDELMVKLEFELPNSIDYTSISFYVYTANFEKLIELGKKLESEYERKLIYFMEAI